MTPSPGMARRLMLGSSALTFAAALAPGLEPAGRAPVFLLASSSHVDFLDLPDPRAHALSEFRAFNHCSKSYWGEAYAFDRWDCLRTVSLGNNPEAVWTRRRLLSLARPAASCLVTNERGGAWTINVYQRSPA